MVAFAVLKLEHPVRTKAESWEIIVIVQVQCARYTLSTSVGVSLLKPNYRSAFEYQPGRALGTGILTL